MDVLYPRTCCFCGKVSKTSMCDVCAKEIVYIEEPRCKRCGKPIRSEEAEFCYDCGEHTVHYDQGLSIWVHKGPVKWSVYQFKYHNQRIYGEFYVSEWYRLYKSQLEEWGVDLIIPIPLHKRRKRKRGYNQAEILAKHLSRLSGIPMDPDAVVRVHNTRPQKELSHKQRKQNLRQAFRIQKDWKPVNSVLLIDDIYTTGNTIDTVAKILKEKGVGKVWFFTISIGQGF